MKTFGYLVATWIAIKHPPLSAREKAENWKRKALHLLFVLLQPTFVCFVNHGASIKDTVSFRLYTFFTLYIAQVLQKNVLYGKQDL